MKPIPTEIGHFPADNSHATKAANGGENIQDLMADAQVLLGRMSHVADPEIALLRSKVAQTLKTARRVVRDGAKQVRRQTRIVIKTGNGYVHDQPWQVIGIAAAAGLLAGLLVGRRYSNMQSEASQSVRPANRDA
jgi:ElaB/YqjD/DUF883 family membrane-anchored ribosome-binding protein